MIKITSSEQINNVDNGGLKGKPDRKKAIIGSTAIIIVVIIIIMILSGGGHKSSPAPSVPTTPTKETLSFGEEGIINFNDSREDCTGSAILGIDKNAYKEIGTALLAKDDIGMLELVTSGKALLVENCTKIKVIDSAVGIRRVRILEGKLFGESGWLDYEWAIK